MANKWFRRRRQGGAVMVEMALTLPLFILLVFAIIELALVVFNFTRAVEATRAGARFAIVNDPVTDLTTLDCSAVTEIVVTCDSANCTDMLARMTVLYKTLDPANVQVRYGCSSTGFPNNPDPIREVSVSISGQEYELILPGLIGFDQTITLPSFTSTRVSEDMYTP